MADKTHLLAVHPASVVIDTHPSYGRALYFYDVFGNVIAIHKYTTSMTTDLRGICYAQLPKKEYRNVDYRWMAANFHNIPVTDKFTPKIRFTL